MGKSQNNLESEAERMSRTKIIVKAPSFGIEELDQKLREKIGQRIVQVAVENAPTDTGYYKSQISYDGANTVTAHARYSAAIEYGFDNYKETVNEHERVITQAFGKPITPVVATVKQHTRTMNRKPNPVMRNAASQVQKEINQIWQEVQKENGL